MAAEHDPAKRDATLTDHAFESTWGATEAAKRQWQQTHGERIRTEKQAQEEQR